MKKLFTLGLAFISSARWRLPINLLLAVAVGYAAVEFGLMSTQPIGHTTLSSISAPAVFHPEATAEIKVTAITEAYLFGRPKVAKTVTPPTQVPPPKTQLQLKLHGIYYSSKPQASFAIIATPQGESAYYQKGNSVPGGALVDKIYPQHVILLSDKRREALYLEGSETTAQHLENQVQSPSRSHASDATPEQLLGHYQQ
ncbi:MAG: type II secretion system protein N, partial [Pseudomonadota bacterium]|nr:type II secretion system protein N [Pseudomonadota bacterium]